VSSRQKGESAPQEERSRRQGRAERILDAAAELLQRWGYRKTTIDDIARQAGVAKGTIYLHWKTRGELFAALMIRERLRAGEGFEQQLASDPEGPTLHGMIKHAVLAALRNPLLKAALLQDTEMLGELAHSEIGRANDRQRAEATRMFLEYMRSRGLIRTDISLDAQLYMLSAITTGYLLIDQFLPDEYSISDEERAELVAETVRRTFEVRAPTGDEQQETYTIFGQALKSVREESQRELDL